MLMGTLTYYMRTIGFKHPTFQHPYRPSRSGRLGTSNKIQEEAGSYQWMNGFRLAIIVHENQLVFVSHVFHVYYSLLICCLLEPSVVISRFSRFLNEPWQPWRILWVPLRFQGAVPGRHYSAGELGTRRAWQLAMLGHLGSENGVFQWSR